MDNVKDSIPLCVICWVCHDLKEDLMGTKFFIIFVKYVVYDWGLGAQVLHMTDSKLHLF